MTNRYPLIIDAADKKLKELPVGDNLRVDGDIITQGNLIGDITGDVVGNLTGNVIGDVTGNLTGTVIGDVTGNLTGTVIGDVTGNLTGTVIGDVIGNVFADDSTLLVDGTNGTIPYSVLSGTPTIPTDISQLNDSLNILDKGFTDLSDTINDYSGRAGQFLRINLDENGIDSAIVSSAGITQQDIINALGYTPYDGNTNPIGFISQETDTLQSVSLRGNVTNVPLTFGDISASNSTVTNSTVTTQFIKTNLNFFDVGQTDDFNISIEANKTLVLASRLSINTSTNNITVLNSNFLGNENSDIGSSTSFWRNVYTDNLITSNTGKVSTTEITNISGDISLKTSSTGRVKIIDGSFQVPFTASKPSVPQPGDLYWDGASLEIFTEFGSPQWLHIAGSSGGAKRGLILPTFTTAQRNALTASDGETIINSSTSRIEFWDGNSWKGVALT